MQENKEKNKETHTHSHRKTPVKLRKSCEKIQHTFITLVEIISDEMKFMGQWHNIWLKSHYSFRFVRLYVCLCGQMQKFFSIHLRWDLSFCFLCCWWKVSSDEHWGIHWLMTIRAFNGLHFKMIFFKQIWCTSLISHIHLGCGIWWNAGLWLLMTDEEKAHFYNVIQPKKFLQHTDLIHSICCCLIYFARIIPGNKLH